MTMMKTCYSVSRVVDNILASLSIRNIQGPPFVSKLFTLPLLLSRSELAGNKTIDWLIDEVEVWIVNIILV